MRLHGPFLVDAHVHLHPFYDIPNLLQCASVNFREEAGRLGLQTARSYVLLLAETGGEPAFARLQGAAEQGQVGGWEMISTTEPHSLLLRNAEDIRLVVIGGRQLGTRERMEVIALACSENLPEGLSLSETVAAVRAGGGLPLVPWGFGKWWFRRGRVIERLVRSSSDGEIYLGDSALRWRGGPTPWALSYAKRNGILILPGTDPLPLSGEAGRVGSYGFVLEGSLNDQSPAESFKSRVRELEGQPIIFGRRAPLHRAIIQQIRLRIGRPHGEGDR